MKAYIVFYMDWNIRTQRKKMFYEIDEFVAIKLDEKLHSTDVFHYTADSGELKAEWRKFRAWLGAMAGFIIWKQNLSGVFEYANSVSKNGVLPIPRVELSEVYERMIPETVPVDGTIEGAMQRLGLVCDTRQMDDALYRTKAIVRLFRKLFRRGEEKLGDEFGNFIRNRRAFPKLWHSFFPEIEREKERERLALFKEHFQKRQIRCRIKKGLLYVEMGHSEWEIEPRWDIKTLKFRTTHYYRGERTLDIFPSDEFDDDAKKERWLDDMIRRMLLVERDIVSGVGNEELEMIVNKLGER